MIPALLFVSFCIGIIWLCLRNQRTQASVVRGGGIIIMHITNDDLRRLADLLRDDKLSSRTQWLIVGGGWCIIVAMIALAYFS